MNRIKIPKLTPEEIKLIRTAPDLYDIYNIQAGIEWHKKYGILAEKIYLWDLYTKLRELRSIDKKILKLREERIPLFQELMKAGVIEMKTWDELDEEENTRGKGRT